MSMASQRYKRKNFSPCNTNPKFPILNGKQPFIGIFNNSNVSVVDKEAIDIIYNEGNFGKGSLSRSAPTYHKGDSDIPAILMQQQWENRMRWKPEGNAESNPVSPDIQKNYAAVNSIQKLLDSAFAVDVKESWAQLKSDEEDEKMVSHVTSSVPHAEALSIISTDDCLQGNNGSGDITFKNMVEEILETRKAKVSNTSMNEYKKRVLVAEKDRNYDKAQHSNLSAISVRFEADVPCINEVLKLDLSEAFFLCFALGCLKIVNKTGQEMKVDELWKKFSETEESFINKYIIYHHYRSFGWTVKSGLKFGGDYLLYKVGPAYFHASYLVWILDRKRKMTWSEFVALNRLVETFNKDLLLCEIIGSRMEDETDPIELDMLSQYMILELKVKRWIPSQEREIKKVKSK